MSPPGHLGRLSSALSSLGPPDLWLVSSDGWHLPSHSLLLSLHSPLTHSLLSSSTLPCSLSLPIPSLPLSLLLSLLSTGSVSHHSMFSPVDILEAAEVLGIEMEDVRIAGSQETNEEDATKEDTNEEASTGYNETTSTEDTTSYNETSFEEVNAPYNETTSVQKEHIEDQKMPENECQTKEETSKDAIDKQVTCIFCEFKTNDLAILKNHVNDHPNENIYNCKVCDKPLKKTSLREHIQNIHSGFRLDCPECDFQTNTRSSLNLHRFRMHKIGSKPFQCPKCRYKAQLREFFRRHMKEKHGIDVPKEENDRMDRTGRMETCDQCVYSTNNAHNMKMHKIRRHKVNFKENGNRNISETNTVKTESIV